MNGSSCRASGTISERKVTVREWMAGKSILITGATGFVGKVLVEKLLRVCSDLERIYLLVRPKKLMSPQQRIDDFINLPIFDNIRVTNPKLFSKLTCISGDVSCSQCQLDEKSLRELRENVQIVFHTAASVRFDMSLKAALAANTVSTLNVLTVVQHFRQLEAFVHVSTAYSQCKEERLCEIVYNCTVPPLKLIEFLQWADERQAAAFVNQLLDGYPNTYSFTKYLTEHVVSTFADRIPISIARPSIVTSSLQEPLRGWVDNVNGPTGLVIGASKGVIRSMHCKAEYLADLIPVDLVVNGLLLTAWDLGTKPRTYTASVVNLTMSNNAITWGQFVKYCRQIIVSFPPSVVLWYPGGSLKSSLLLHKISVLLFHYLPAYAIDMLLVLSRKKPFLVRTQDRIQQGLKMLQFYTTRKWDFENKNWNSIHESLDENEKEIFYSNNIEIDWFQYLSDYVYGIRHYCLNEDPKTISKSKKLIQRFYYLDKFVKFIFFGLLLMILSKLFYNNY